jgi:hypothetical protein
MQQDDQAISLERRAFCAGALGLATLGSVACGGGDDAGTSAGASGTATPDGPNTGPAARTFVHPGLLHTEADFERMRTKVAAGAPPWSDGWNALIANGRAQLGASPRPLATVTRSATLNNSPQMYIDIARAYQTALRWKVSGDTAYADHAVRFLNAWSSTLTAIEGNADRFLAAGIYGYQFANAAELMRDYPGWAAADFARFQNMMLTVFYPMNHHFLVKHNDADITNYWANWDQCALASILAIGVLCDRQDLYDEAIDYYRNGQGNGAALQAVSHVHPGHLGQWQESGRDQGHCTLGIGLAATFCEMAWNQGDDLYGHENNRLLAGAEYVAKSNLRDANGEFFALPFEPYRNIHSFHTGVSPAGQGHLRPVWEMVHHHYVNRRGLAAPYTARQAQQLRPETDAGNGDQLGFGTLTFTREPLAVDAAPSGLTAHARGSQVVLSWWGTAGASGYNVKRATSPSGPWATIASGLGDLLTHTDADVAGAPAYHYVVTAITPSGETGPSAAARVAVQPELLAHLKLDEAAGATAADASGNGHAGTLVGGAQRVAGRSGSAVALDGIDAHLRLPAGLLADVADFTIAVWVHANAAATHSRVFDFGAGPRRWMSLTARSGAGTLRFAISTAHGRGAQGIDGAAALPTGRWVHVAVTLHGTVGTLYVDGSAVGTNSAMTLAPCQLGRTTQNWIGRSQYAADPWLDARVQDLRVYRGALDASQIAALMR